MGYRDPAMAPDRHFGMRRRSVGIAPYVSAGASLAGTALPSVLESEVVTGSETILIDVTGVKLKPSGTAFNAARQAIIDGMTAAATPTNGWNNEVRDKAAVTVVARTSDSRITVTLPATAGYSVAADETVTVTVPASAFEHEKQAVVAGTLTVTNEA